MRDFKRRSFWAFMAATPFLAGGVALLTNGALWGVAPLVIGIALAVVARRLVPRDAVDEVMRDNPEIADEQVDEEAQPSDARRHDV